MLRIPPTLPAELEELIHRVIGCCIAVHRALGPGLPELAYSRAVAFELDAHGIGYQRERAFEVRYRERVVCAHRVDFLVEDDLILELKSVERLEPVHTAQAITYLRVTHRRAALVINFNVDVLKLGIRRVVA